MDRPELREKRIADLLLSNMPPIEGVFDSLQITNKVAWCDEIAKRISLALIPDIEELDKIRDEITGLNKKLDDREEDLVEAKKQETTHTLAQLRYYLSKYPISPLWDTIEGYCQSLEGELEALESS